MEVLQFRRRVVSAGEIATWEIPAGEIAARVTAAGKISARKVSTRDLPARKIPPRQLPIRDLPTLWQFGTARAEAAHSPSPPPADRLTVSPPFGPPYAT